MTIAVKKHDVDDRKASRKALYTAYRVCAEAMRVAHGKEPKVSWRNCVEPEETQVWETMLEIRRGVVMFQGAVSKVNEMLNFLDNETKNLSSYNQLPNDISDETKKKLDRWFISLSLPEQ